MIWHDLSHHVVVLAAVSTNGARVLKTRRAGKIGLSGGCGAKKWRARRKLLSEKKGMDGADRFFNYGRDNDHCVVYTSPPPAAEPLLKEKPF